MPRIVTVRKTGRNLTIFIPEEFDSIIKEFEKYAKKDKRFLKKIRYSSKYILSLAIRTLINAYVQQQKINEEEKNGQIPDINN